MKIEIKIEGKAGSKFQESVIKFLINTSIFTIVDFINNRHKKNNLTYKITGAEIDEK